MIKKSSSAFTLIEVSAAIVIIGILIAGVMGANGLVKKSKIAAAQTLTKASPIAGITDNALWLESGVESSFKNTETSTGDSVTAWYDQKNSVNKSSVVAVGTGPTYSNTINYIHTVKFSGSATNYLQVLDASFLNNSDYTIIVLEKRQSSTAGYFIGDSSVSTANQTLLLGYSADASIAHSQGTGNVYTSNISTYSSSSDTPRVFTFISDSTNGKKTYINVTLAAQSSDTTKLSNITTLAIGKGYTGEIGEIAIFTRALKKDERQGIEDYLGKKWDSNINRDVVQDCTAGTVTSEGCIQSCQVSVVGSNDTAPRDNGQTGLIACNQTGYDSSDSISYTCSNGQAITGTCGCNTANGYAFDASSQTCTLSANCAIPNDIGVVENGTINQGTGTLNCDTANNFAINNYSDSTASNTLDYNCDASGTLTITSTDKECECDTTKKLSFYNTTTETCDEISATAWFDAADTSTITSSSGLVSAWRDKYGSFNLSQNTASAQPISGTRQINSLNSLDFQGGDYLTTNTIIPVSSGSYTIFFVLLNDGGGTLYGNSGANNYIAHNVSINPTTAAIMMDEYLPSGGSLSGGNFAVGQKNLVTTINDSWKPSIYKNGSLVASRNTQEVYSGGGQQYGIIGGRLANNALYAGSFDGAMGEVLFFNRVLTTAERQKIESYLGSKWAISVSN